MTLSKCRRWSAPVSRVEGLLRLMAEIKVAGLCPRTTETSDEVREVDGESASRVWGLAGSLDLNMDGGGGGAQGLSVAKGRE
jgi:hypothetical protein